MASWWCASLRLKTNVHHWHETSIDPVDSMVPPNSAKILKPDEPPKLPCTPVDQAKVPGIYI